MAEELEKELDDDVDSSDEEPKKGKAGRFELLTTQCMVCICALLVLFGIKFVGGAVYDDARAAYAGTYDDPTSANEVMGLISKVFGAPGGGGYAPARCSASARFTPAAATSMSTSADPRRGSGSVVNSSFSGPPGADMVTTRILTKRTPAVGAPLRGHRPADIPKCPFCPPGLVSAASAPIVDARVGRFGPSHCKRWTQAMEAFVCSAG